MKICSLPKKETKYVFTDEISLLVCCSSSIPIVSYLSLLFLISYSSKEAMPL